MAVEEVLSSKGKLRILKVLAEVGRLHISEIAKRAGLNHTTAANHLEFLESHGLVSHKRFGRIRIYQLNEKDPRVAAIKKLFEVWERT
ncbi:MAG TPA: ArsR family transcriptional regulator [Candidatus Bathyarchaeota archaeon]|nr:MAG: ArsR family transcriptional regulator [Candidatus Bathyarchaeota archaeon]HDI07488.1 ArsR family transcriptional regulator [Candidatus Bathyarchaeota archaeon]